MWWVFIDGVYLDHPSMVWRGGVGMNGCLFYGPAGSRPKGCTRDLVNIDLGLYYKNVNKGVSCGSVREPYNHNNN